MNPEHTIQDDSDILTIEEREALYEYPVYEDTEAYYEYDGEYCTEVYENENPF